eukprot:scaffold84604_cov47-Attheya_sp.AAC.5
MNDSTDTPMVYEPQSLIPCENSDETLRFPLHEPVTPPTPAESFFLSPVLKIDKVSAVALAAQLGSEYKRTRHHNYRHSSAHSSISASALSTATDDFASACESQNLSDDERYLDEVEFSDDDSSRGDSIGLFANDPLLISRQPIPEETFEDAEDKLETMAKKNFKSDKKVVTTTTVATTEEHADISQKVYDGVKGVWDVGKGIVIVKPFLRFTEFVASKVIGITGHNLEDVDNGIKPFLSKIDDSFVNPTVEFIMGMIITPVMTTSANISGTIVGTVTAPFTKKEAVEDDKVNADALTPEVSKPVSVSMS